VAVGESDFSNSPANRRRNIAVGLEKFNGALVAPGETFSFVETLGPVDAKAGFLKELVIKGDRTVPDFGGGLCQVSSTAYRGVWEAGYPIAARQNHSYVVSHYAPVGTDATIYQPSPDMKFVNDGAESLLIQTYAEGNDAYFIYYGTKVERQTDVLGPFIWGRTGVPPSKVEYTSALAPGQRKNIGNPVPGMKVAWYRVTRTPDGKEKTEPFYSSYGARPLFYQVGISGAPAGGDGAAGTAGIPSGDVPAVTQ
jgi:vancomycin resistance protein YoaR